MRTLRAERFEQDRPENRKASQYQITRDVSDPVIDNDYCINMKQDQASHTARFVSNGPL